ncbi:DNA-binding response regulator, partial [Pseudomonas sp. SIMBA_067]
MSRKVLVVDDEAPIREMLVFVLEQNGFQAIEAE